MMLGAGSFAGIHSGNAMTGHGRKPWSFDRHRNVDSEFNRLESVHEDAVIFLIVSTYIVMYILYRSTLGKLHRPAAGCMQKVQSSRED